MVGYHRRIHVSGLVGCYRRRASTTVEEARTLTTVQQVEASIVALVARFGTLDPGYRAMLPTRRTIEARCTDIDVMYHARWNSGQLSEVVPGPAPRAHIRIHVSADDLVLLADGILPFKQAWAEQRVRIDASMTDLLRLRAVL